MSQRFNWGLVLVAVVFFLAGALMAPLLSPTPAPYGGMHQQLNLKLVELEKDQLREKLRGHPRWNGITVSTFTGLNGSLQIDGTVASDEDRLELFDFIAEQQLPVPIWWRVRSGEPGQ